MSVKLTAWAIAYEGLDPLEKLLLIVLADHFNDQEGAAWPSQKRIAKMMGVSDRTVRRLQVSLVEKDLLKVQLRTGSSNQYIMVTPDILSAGVGHRSPKGADTAVLHNSYITLNEHKKNKLKNESTPIPPKYKPPKDESVKPQRAQEHIKEIRRKLKAV
jgi:hypothetical protein